MHFQFPPHRCYALGCARRAEELFCDRHEPLVPTKYAKALEKHYTERWQLTRRVQKEWMAAAYRAATAIGLAEGKIKKDIAERRDYYAKTKLEA